ncbi:MAG: hypothetical protein ACLR8P_16835 [Clostridium fessum]
MREKQFRGAGNIRRMWRFAVCLRRWSPWGHLSRLSFRPAQIP